MPDPDLTLYASDYCPFCHACRLVIAKKKIPCRIELIDLSSKSGFPQLLSPYGRVPVLMDNSEAIYESLIINEYLEEKYPAVGLLPKSPSRRARVRFWCDFVMTRIVPAYFSLMNSDQPEEWPDLGANFDKWLKFADERAFDEHYFGSDTLSLADYTLYPWFERIVSIERYRGVTLNERHKKLHGWLRLVETTQTVRSCAKYPEEYISFFDEYYDPV